MTASARWKPLWGHLKKYLTVGAGSATTDFLVFTVLCRYTGWSAWAANLISRPCGGCFSFCFNKFWTFSRRESRGTGRQLLRYWMTWLVTYGASELLVWALSRRAGWSAFASKVTAECAVNAAGFLVHRHWTFRPPVGSSAPASR
jgi:putative flippase GtrA